MGVLACQCGVVFCFGDIGQETCIVMKNGAIIRLVKNIPVFGAGLQVVIRREAEGDIRCGGV